MLFKNPSYSYSKMYLNAYFPLQTKCITLFVTHYPAVVQLENDIPSVANYHMGYLLESEEADNGKTTV